MAFFLYQFKTTDKSSHSFARYMLNFTLKFVSRFFCLPSVAAAWIRLLVFILPQIFFFSLCSYWGAYCAQEMVQGYRFERCFYAMPFRCASNSKPPPIHGQQNRSYAHIRNVLLKILVFIASIRHTGNQNKWMERAECLCLRRHCRGSLMWCMRVWNKQTNGDATDANKILKFTANLFAAACWRFGWWLWWVVFFLSLLLFVRLVHSPVRSFCWCFLLRLVRR